MDISELIIKLADNELSPDERESLEKELYSNPKLMQEYLMYLEMNEFMKERFAQKGLPLLDKKKEKSAAEKSMDAEKEALNSGTFYSTIDFVKEINEKRGKSKYDDDLKEFVSLGIKDKNDKTDDDKETTKIIQPKKSLVRKWYLLAASIVILISVSVVLWKSVFSPTDYSALYTSYYQPYFFVVDQTRSSDANTDSLVNLATELYKDGNYQQALELCDRVLKIDNKHVKALFIHALCLIEAKNFKGAADEFKQILSGYDSYQLESKWYLTLCFLQLDKPNDARELLSELSVSKNLYQKRALELLDKIKD
jgi:tetratricopeptide (TPR) repeat protein